MPKIRVLVVDDAVVIRRMVSGEIGNDPALDVVGTAANGRIALAMMTQVNPDVVILDIEMPELDGLATLKELRKNWPLVPVIMFSALTERGAEATLDALALGATAYFTKPASMADTTSPQTVIREQLIPMIKAIGTRALERKGIKGVSNRWPATESVQTLSKTSPGSTVVSRPPALSAPGALESPNRQAGAVEILVIGSSTGGPNALAEVFRRLSSPFPIPILIVQHMPPMFTRLLAERLTAQFAIPVHEAASGTKLEPGSAWIAPGDYHMLVSRTGCNISLRLNQEPPENSCRPAVDVLLRSVAKTFGGSTLAVILTGMGQDGLRGCEAIREAGGQVLAQDEASSVVWGMPGHVCRAGLANRVLPLSLIADEIIRRVRPDQSAC